MEKNQQIAKYKAGRIMIIFFILISILNCGVLLFFNDGTIVLSSILPQLALSIILQGTNVLSAILMIIFMIIAPIVIYIVAFIFSRNNYKWLLLCIMVMGADFAVLLYYLATSNYITSAIPDLLIEIMVIYSVAIAYMKGKKLNNDFEVIQEKVPSKKINGRKIYEYSKDLAKKNKTNKTVQFYSIFGILALVLYVISTIITNNKEILGDAVAFLFSVLLIIVILGIYIFAAIKFAPYTSASSCYFYTEKNIVHRADAQTQGYDIPLQDLELVTETEREYICTYFNGKKTKKIIIPKCYDGIEEIIK